MKTLDAAQRSSPIEANGKYNPAHKPAASSRNFDAHAAPAAGQDSIGFDSPRPIEVDDFWTLFSKELVCDETIEMMLNSFSLDEKRGQAR